MTFSLSTDAIIEEIYAASALYNIVNPATAGRDLPPVLHRDHRAMLTATVGRAFRRLACALLPFVEDVGEPDASADADADRILTLDLRMPPDFPSARLRPLRLLMEHAIGCEALAEAYISYDRGLAESSASSAADCYRRLTATLSRRPPLSLQPSW